MMKKYTALVFALTVAFVNNAYSQVYIKGPALVEGVTSTATAAGTTTLTVASQMNQVLTGATTQTVVLPDATTLVIGQSFYISNKSSGTVTVNFNGGSLALSIMPSSEGLFRLLTNGTSAGTWDVSSYTSGASVAGSDTQVQFNNSGAFGASDAFTWVTANEQLTIGKPGTAVAGSVGIKTFNNLGTTSDVSGMTASLDQGAGSPNTGFFGAFVEPGIGGSGDIAAGIKTSSPVSTGLPLVLDGQGGVNLYIGTGNLVGKFSNGQFELDGGSTANAYYKITTDGNVSRGGPTGGVDLTDAMTRTSSAPGNSLTIQSGGAGSGTTDSSAGILTLKGGVSTGTGDSSVEIQTATTGVSTGSSDNVFTSKFKITGFGEMFVGDGTYNPNYLLYYDPTAPAMCIGCVDAFITEQTGGVIGFGGNIVSPQISPNRNLSSGAGRAIIIRGGRPQSGQTNANGGATQIRGGPGTGSGTSTILFQTFTPGASGTADQNTQATRMSVDGLGNVLVKTDLQLEDPGAGTNTVTMQAPTLSGSYTLTMPVDAGTVGQMLTTDGTGVLSWSSSGGGGTVTSVTAGDGLTATPNPITSTGTISLAPLKVVDGGDAPYTILSTDNVVVSLATLSSDQTYTLPPCTGGNIGELHRVKNQGGQSFNVILAADGTDNIDGASTVTLATGDADEVICMAAASWGVF